MMGLQELIALGHHYVSKSPLLLLLLLATKELHEKPLAWRIINPLAEKERSKREMTRNYSEDVTLLFNNYIRTFSTFRISKELFEVDSIISRYFCPLRCRYCYFPFWSREYRQHSKWIQWWERVGKLSTCNVLRHFEKVCIEQTKLAIFPSTWHCKGEFCFYRDCSISLFIM